MKDIMKNAANQEKIAALRLAEIKATDREDLINCANDISKGASLDQSEALEIAKAIRAKYLPNLAKQAGISDIGVKKLLNFDNGAEQTADFVDESDDDMNEDMHHLEDDEDEFDNDIQEDNDEVEDNDDIAKIVIEVPADMVDAAQKAVQEALDNLLGGEDSDFDMQDDDMDFDDEDQEEDMEDDDMEEDVDDEDMEDDSEPMHKFSNGVNKMSKNAQASRRAEREEILRRLAAEEDGMKASASFSYNNDKVSFPGEVEYPTMSLDSSEGNSLKDDNFTPESFAVPTLNGKYLQTKDATNPVTMPGSKDGSLEYVLDAKLFETPSAGNFDVDQPSIPTQMPGMGHKTTVANDNNKKMCECNSCGYKTKLAEHEMASYSCPECKKAGMSKTTVANDNNKQMCECTSCGYKTTLAEHEMASYDCPECKKAGMSKDKDVHATNTEFDLNSNKMKITSSEEFSKVAALETARIKTAFSCSSKLALAGIIDANEIDSYADQMLNDNLKADAMIRQTKLLLKSAQTSSERIAAAAAEKMNTRTAQTIGISTSPAFSGSSVSNGAALDIQSALKGTWTMPNIED